MNEIKKKMKFLKNITILYVEDNEDIRNEIVFSLEHRVKTLYVQKMD